MSDAAVPKNATQYLTTPQNPLASFFCLHPYPNYYAPTPPLPLTCSEAEVAEALCPRGGINPSAAE